MIKKDDPRLTAFVLGELDANEASQVQDAIDASPELQTFVEEIRETVGMLGEQYALDLESGVGGGELSDDQRAAILAADSNVGSGSGSTVNVRSNKAGPVAAGANPGGAVLLRWAVAAGIGLVLASLAFYAGNDWGKDVAENGSGSEEVTELSPQQIVLQSSKYPTETWEQYVERMGTIGLVDAEQVQAWNEGRGDRSGAELSDSSNAGCRDGGGV